MRRRAHSGALPELQSFFLGGGRFFVSFFFSPHERLSKKNALPVSRLLEFAGHLEEPGHFRGRGARAQEEAARHLGNKERGAIRSFLFVKLSLVLTSRG